MEPWLGAMVLQGQQNLFRGLEEGLKRRKLEAQETTTTRKLWEILNEGNKDAIAWGRTVGLPDLRGAVQGKMLKQAEDKHMAELAAAQQLQQLQGLRVQREALNLQGDQEAMSGGRAFLEAVNSGGVDLEDPQGMMQLMAQSRLPVRDWQGMMEVMANARKAKRPMYEPGTVRPIDLDLDGKPDLGYLVQNSEGAGSMVPWPGRKVAAKPPTELDAARQRKLNAEAEKLERDNAADRESDPAVVERKDAAQTLAQLQSMRQRGVKTVTLSKKGTMTEVGEPWFGGRPIEDAIAQVNAILQSASSGGGGNAAGSEPAPGTIGSQSNTNNVPAGKFTLRTVIKDGAGGEDAFAKEPVISTREAATSLPEGTLFRGPDGKIYRRKK